MGQKPKAESFGPLVLVIRGYLAARLSTFKFLSKEGAVCSPGVPSCGQLSNSEDQYYNMFIQKNAHLKSE